MQTNNNEDVVVAYGSRAFSKIERHNAISELELLRLVSGVKSNHVYLSTQHVHFTVKTDHKILSTMFK